MVLGRAGHDPAVVRMLMGTIHPTHDLPAADRHRAAREVSCIREYASSADLYS